MQNTGGDFSFRLKSHRLDKISLYENGNLGNVGSEVFTQDVWNVWFSLLVSV